MVELPPKMFTRGGFFSLTNTLWILFLAYCTMLFYIIILNQFKVKHIFKRRNAMKNEYFDNK